MLDNRRHHPEALERRETELTAQFLEKEKGILGGLVLSLPLASGIMETSWESPEYEPVRSDSQMKTFPETKSGQGACR